jgi:hexosaminidase
LTIYYTFDNTDPDFYSNKYDLPLSIPKNAARLRVITYKDEKPVGKVITLGIDELQKNKR